jgi:microcystin-dependent protein
LNRVTRVGEFSPNEWFFALGSCMKITEVAHIFRLLYSTVMFMH